jgi:CelD/BcsL family acetyltransferase involved in cellulose biosynthesis
MASDQQLSITVYDNLESLNSLRPEWDALLDDYAFSTTFSTYEWLVPWWRAFGGGSKLAVVALRNRSSELVGLAAMAIVSRRVFPRSLRVLRLLGQGSHDSDNLDVPVRPGYEDTACRALFDWMAKNASLWDICELNTLPLESVIGARAPNELEKRKWMCYRSTRPQTIVELADSWETHLKGISSKERGKIGLRTRKLEKKYAMQIYRCGQESQLESRLNALYELHRKHWALRGLPGTLHSPARRAFYGELARLLLARGRLEFWILELNGKIVATQFGLRHRTTVFSLQEGFDPDYAADSVGYVLRSHVLKQVIGEGIRRYDFLGGTDESKMRWGGQLRHYVNLHFARPLTLGSVYLAGKDQSRAGKQWLRAHLPEGVWKGFKRALGIKPATEKKPAETKSKTEPAKADPNPPPADAL